MRATALPYYVTFQQRSVIAYIRLKFCTRSRWDYQITMVGPLGLLISNYCIIRYLASVVTPNNGVECRQSSRRRMITDYLACFAVPAIIATSSVVFQVARYQVFKLVGCSTVSALTWPTLIIFLIWSPILCGISCGYSGDFVIFPHLQSC